jgi:serine O-acetyltransferase
MTNFRADLRRHFDGPVTVRAFCYALFEMSLWSIAAFRFAKWVQRLRFAPLRWTLLVCYFFVYKLLEALSGIRISSESKIGPGLVIHNFGGVLIKGNIGANCTVIQGAQIIARADGQGRGWPTLGHNVFVGAGAKILGNVTIGHNVRVGANAVVVTDVPDDSVVMPPECKVIKGFYRFKHAVAAQGEK